MAEHKKIAIVGGWHDDNKGDSAIVLAMIGLVKETYGDCTVSLVSTICADDPTYQNAHRHIVKYDPDITIAPASHFGYHPSKSHKKWEHAVNVIKDFFGAVLEVTAGRPKSAGLQLIQDADVVLVKGGHLFHCRRNDPLNFLGLIITLFPVLAALRYGKKVIFFGQSFGPFEGPVSQWLMKKIFDKADYVLPREQISEDFTLRNISDKRKVIMIPDAAFAVTPDKNDKVRRVMDAHGLEEGKFWTITVRQWVSSTSQTREAMTEPYLREMKSLIDMVLGEKMTDKIVIYTHVIGPSVVEDDRVPSRRLKQAFAADERVVLIEEDLSPEECCAFYASSAFVIGTRFHSVILALAGGTPAMAISYFGPKSWGIMKMLGYDQWCFDMHNLSAHTAFEKIKTIDLEESRAQLGHRIDQLKDTLSDAMGTLNGNAPALAQRPKVNA